MTQILERLQKDVASLKRDVRQLQRQLTLPRHTSAARRLVVAEEGELADDVVTEVQASRRRKREEFVSHEALMKKYGVR